MRRVDIFEKNDSHRLRLQKPDLIPVRSAKYGEKKG